MTRELTDGLKAQVVITAAGIAGPEASDADVADHVSRITAMLQDGSAAMSAFDRAEARAGATVKTKTFPASVLFVDLEESSQRPIVFVKTEPSNYHPDGVEHFRMDRTDSRDGARVKDLAKTATELVGHKVLITLAVESTGEKNVRVLRNIEDRGADAELGEFTLADGAAYIDWTEKDRAKIAPKLVRLGKLAPAGA